MRTFAVLPVKRFAAAKQRLADELDPPTRELLVEAMVRDVTSALAQVRGLEGIVVVTSEPRAKAPSREAGAEIVPDPRERGQSDAARAGIEHVLAVGGERVLLVPGDCPGLDPGEVDDLLSERHPAPAVAIVPDRHGTGTNGLLLSPPDVIAPAFGPGSFARHAAAARTAGVEPAVRRPRSLLHDVDTGPDLEALRAALPFRPRARLRTSDVLGALARRSVA